MPFLRFPSCRRGYGVFSILIVLSIGLSVASAQDIHPNASSSFFPFLDLGYDARATAMGGAAVGMPNQLYGVMSNPSALAFVEKRQVLLGYRPVILDVQGTPLAYGMPLVDREGGNWGVGALHLLYMSFGTIQEPRDAGGNLLDISPGEYSVGGGISWAAKVLEEVSIGATIKGLYDKQYGLEGHVSGASSFSATGIATDLGAQYRVASDRLIVGIALRNIGLMLSTYGRDIEGELPLTGAIGFSYQPRHVPGARIAADLEKPSDDYLRLRGGVEIGVYEQFLLARIGYALSSEDIRKRLATLTGDVDDDYVKTEWSSLRFGLGFNIPMQEIDASIDATYEARIHNISSTFALSAIVTF